MSSGGSIGGIVDDSSIDTVPPAAGSIVTGIGSLSRLPGERFHFCPSH
jgi:hypothetical protein